MPDDPSDDLRAKDLVRRGEVSVPQRRSALADRINHRAKAAPGSERRARLFKRIGVADPYDADAKDKGLALGDVSILQEKRQPAPHAMPKEPEKKGPAGPKLPNVPRADDKPKTAPSAAQAGAQAQKAAASGNTPPKPTPKPTPPARNSMFAPKTNAPALAPLPVRPGVVPPGSEGASTSTPSRPPPPRPSVGGVANAAPRSAPPSGPDLAELGAAGPERPPILESPRPSSSSSGRVGIARPTLTGSAPVERPVKPLTDTFTGADAAPAAATPALRAPDEDELPPAPKAASSGPPPVSRKPPSPGGGADLDDLFGFSQNEGRLRMPAKKKKDEPGQP